MTTFSATQPCCDRCWVRHYGSLEPTRVTLPDREVCVFCGALADGGIYVRVNPREAVYPSLEDG